MSTQDNEIDQLFQSQLYHHEVEPTGRVWSNVAATLDGDRRKRLGVSWLSIAATVLVVVSAGWYFIPQVKIKGQKPQQMPVAQNNMGAKTIVAPKPAGKPVIISQPVQNVMLAATVKTGRLKPVKNIRRNTVGPAVTDRSATQTTVLNNRHHDFLAAVVPDVETPLSVKPVADEQVVFKTSTNALAAAQQVPANKTMAAAPVKKRRINSLGDLINVVVSKVDKRKDKLIEFSNSDGDESTITGINLGFVKIKKD